MTEAIAISLSAKLGVVLSRSAVLSISRLFGVRSDIAAAKRDLDLLRAFLRFADSRYGADGHAAEWVKQVRDAAFELEDVADECSYLSDHGLSRDCIDIKAWFALSRRLREARERLRQVSAAKDRYGIRFADDSTAPSATAISATTLAESAHFLEKEEVVGFSAQEKQLLEWVFQDAEPRRTLVAVHGMGGVGKTTLVTHVYKQVANTGHFDCAAWVSVSQSFTLEDLLRRILQELQRDARWGTVRSGNHAAVADYRSLVAAMREHLSERRYLVVLDDVWDAHLWTKLRHALLDVGNGSRVVITTRRRDVAQAAAPERTMMLEPLPYPEAWELFCTVAFREVPGQTCPGHLKALAVNILQRCHGLPLAIVSVGSLLALKERTEFSWRNVHDTLVWDRRSSDPRIGEAARILNLSIDDLPDHLKKCFLSCSIYPEDFLVKRKIVIREWVAQGFIEEKPGQRKVEDVADDYLDQIVQRNLMLVVQRNEFGRAKRCVIHDLIRELIIHRSREEERHLHLLKCKITINSKDVIRHLAVDRCGVDSEYVQQLATLRSFNAFGSELDASFLSGFRLITVLHLWFIEMTKLPDAVTNLHNLQYLGIRSTLIEELPKELGKLQKLQTLDTKLSMVKRLPSSIAKLKCLCHLLVLKRATTDLLKPYPGMPVGVPKGIKNLTSLQTLKYVQADKMIVRSLARLEEMRSLDLSGLNASLITDLSSSISRMNCLLRLGLTIEPGADTVLDLESISPPPLKLQYLALTGRLAGGKLPSWTSSITRLVYLRLSGCQIGHDSFVLLGALPRLVNLCLITAYHERNMVFVEGSFLALQKLTLEDMPNLSHIEFQEGCLVNLRHLGIGQCTELTEASQGMGKLRHLQNLELFGMPKEFVENLKEQNGDARYHNPANSDFYQAHRFLRCIRFVENNK